MIHSKYCSTGATGAPQHHALKRRDSEDFGRVVYSPDNLTHQRHAPDWGAIDRGFERPGKCIQIILTELQCNNQEPRYELVFGSGGIDPGVLNLGTKLRFIVLGR
jgi:hypothetical protein